VNPPPRIGCTIVSGPATLAMRRRVGLASLWALALLALPLAIPQSVRARADEVVE